MAIESIGIIPDGTRRWAIREGLPLYDAYVLAFGNLAEHIDALEGRKVAHIHIYLFSIYNLNRNRSQIVACLDAECEFILSLVSSGHSITIHGDINPLEMVHPNIARTARRVMNKPSCKTRSTLIHLYIGYSFRHHIEQMESSTDNIESLMTTLLSHKIDLVIRTGGAITLSDFLPIESRYAQIHFLPMLFNDFTTNELETLCDLHERLILSLKYGE